MKKNILKNALIALLMLFLHKNAFAQEKTAPVLEDKPKPTFGFDGQIAITTNGKSFFMNMGGPGIKFTRKPFAVSFNMFPSLMIAENAPKPLITPTLGAGFQIFYKRLILSMPLYYVVEKGNPTQQWVFSAGLGFKLSK